MAKKTNYLNNKELLKEINHSKMSYCAIYDDSAYHYDTIIHSLTELDDCDITTIDENGVKHTERGMSPAVSAAIQAKADRVAAENHAAALKEWESQETRKAKDKPRPVDFKFDGKDKYTKNDIVVRLMTFSHIPKEPSRKNKPKSTADMHAKCNFPPFVHVALREGAWTEVVRSHWTGDIATGEFTTTSGRMTEKLAAMMITLCKRYSMRSNWRGYTYVDEMRSHALMQLSQIGLYFDESKSLNPFAYYTAAISNSFTRVLNLEKRNQNIRDDLLQQQGQLPSFSRQLDNEMASHYNDDTDY